MLVFVSFDRHNLEVTSVEELSADFSVDAAKMGNQKVEITRKSPEIIKGSLVSNMLGDGTPRKSDMVRRTQNKDGLHHPVVHINQSAISDSFNSGSLNEPRVNLSEAVCSSWPRVAIPSMGTYHSTGRRILQTKI